MDAGISKPKPSHAGCSRTQVAAAIHPCPALEAKQPLAKGFLSLLEKPRHKRETVLEEGLKALALRALEQSLFSQVYWKRQHFSASNKSPRFLTPAFNHEEAQQVHSARQPTFRYVWGAAVESPSMFFQGIWATTLTWKSVNKVKDEVVEGWRWDPSDI